MVLFILYVDDQKKSAEFYSQLLQLTPILDVPGMTEFLLQENCKLRLMPNSGISKIICPYMPEPQLGKGIPRCEVYIYVEELELVFCRAVEAGAKLISPIEIRNWGDKVCYFADPDGHIIAFAEKFQLS